MGAKDTGASTFKLIPLSNSDKMVMVDEDDYEYLSQFNWFADRKGYALRKLPRNGGPSRSIRMHREILNAKSNQQVDHCNRNKLDNRRLNLRISDASGNVMNQGLRKDNSSGYKGVTFCKDKKSNPWRAWISVGGKRVELGYFETAELAAVRYNQAALKYHQEYAYLNPIKTS